MTYLLIIMGIVLPFACFFADNPTNCDCEVCRLKKFLGLTGENHGSN